VTSAGEVHAVKLAPSSEHSNIASASSDENVNVAVVSSVGEAGPESIEVSGGVESTVVHVREDDPLIASFVVEGLTAPASVSNRPSPGQRRSPVSTRDASTSCSSTSGCRTSAAWT
jgi:hypothetical protein